MNKEELITEVHNRSGLTKKNIREVLNPALDTIIDLVSKNEPVTINDFGQFSKQNRAERCTTNPFTHEPMVIPAHSVVAFKPGKKFRESVK